LWSGEYVIEDEFYEFKGTRFGACVSGVADAIASNGDAGAIGF
jgi:hypothetical protein